jgi:UPF0176 protein
VNSVLNVSAYRFVEIADPHALRDSLRENARRLGLRGTILLASEGINLFLAGAASAVRDFVSELRANPLFAGLDPKESWSAQQPFGKLLVKVKREIIRMNTPGVQPARSRAPALDTTTARRWIEQGHDDRGRPLALLDTRNAFEVDYGTFEGALDWRLAKFSEFPAALAGRRHELEGKAVISFCTGGIRCEKAAIHMRDAGLDNVWQLEGGILKYFEETGGAGFRGRCFVFDGREALESDLTPRSAAPQA